MSMLGHSIAVIMLLEFPITPTFFLLTWISANLEIVFVSVCERERVCKSSMPIQRLIYERRGGNRSEIECIIK